MEETKLEWNREAQRVDQVSTLRYDALILDETRQGKPPAEEAAALLAQKALEAGVAHFLEPAAVANLRARYGFAQLPGPDAAQELTTLCAGLRSFRELEAAGKHWMAAAEAEAERTLGNLAPATVRLASGRAVRVQYEDEKPPYIASRLQDFFGMRATPLLGPRRVPVVVHLLGPHGRPLQTTADLAGFWQRLYPQLRRELMRRYPRHAWPEDPLSATATERRRPGRE